MKTITNIYFAISLILIVIGADSELEGLMLLLSNLAFSGLLLITFNEDIQKVLGLTDKE